LELKGFDPQHKSGFQKILVKSDVRRITAPDTVGGCTNLIPSVIVRQARFCDSATGQEAAVNIKMKTVITSRVHCVVLAVAVVAVVVVDFVVVFVAAAAVVLVHIIYPTKLRSSSRRSHREEQQPTAARVSSPCEITWWFYGELSMSSPFLFNIIS